MVAAGAVFAVLRLTAPGDCERLSGELPEQLEPGVELRARNDEAAVWGDPPIELRCDVARPAGWRLGVVPVGVNGVSWYVHPAGDEFEWTVVDRPVYLTVTVPVSYEGQGARFFTTLSDAIADALPERDLDPGPLPQPPLVSASPSPRASPT